MSGLNMSVSTIIAMTEGCAEIVAPAMGPIVDSVAAFLIVHCNESRTSAVVNVTFESKGSVNGGKEPVIEIVIRIVWIHGASNQIFTYLHMSRSRG